MRRHMGTMLTLLGACVATSGVALLYGWRYGVLVLGLVLVAVGVILDRDGGR